MPQGGRVFADSRPPARHRSARHPHRLRRPLLSCVGACAVLAAVAAGVTGADTTGGSGAAAVPRDAPAAPALVAADVTPTLEDPRRLAATQRRDTAASEHRERLARKVRTARAAERARLAAMDPRDLARSMASRRGWGAGQFRCLDSLWTRESGWNRSARNPSSGAYGIPQALPGSKMASVGADWRTNPVTQIRWGLQYIAASYGSPCGAWSHSQSHGWY
jgi:hypothetical protein